MHAAATLARDDAPAAARRARILLVEDSARLAASIRDYLKQQGYEVLIEGDGRAAASRFERHEPDLVAAATTCRSSSSPRAAMPLTKCSGSASAPMTTS